MRKNSVAGSEISLDHYLSAYSKMVDAELKKLFVRHKEEPASVNKAMSYSVFAGGKRLRPILVLAAHECCGGDAEDALKTAAALEMIHTYSLIHDDLPAMDDDDLRRGRPTNHKVFGEALAILAGDGLLTYAFEVAAQNSAEMGLDGKRVAALIQAIACGAGSSGMVGGQAADLEAENWKSKNHGFNPERHLEYIHLHKTAALIVASLEAGAILAKASEREIAALARYGRSLGLAFQIADDVLDAVGDKKKMGKMGSDVANNKLTYVSLYGVEKARSMARREASKAKAALDVFSPQKSRWLKRIADYTIERDK